MALKSIEVNNIMVFRSFSLDFERGIHVLVGENGTGKSTVLKMLYAAAERLPGICRICRKIRFWMPT